MVLQNLKFIPTEQCGRKLCNIMGTSGLEDMSPFSIMCVLGQVC